MPLTYLHYDVFTGERLLGNQLAVFTDARGVDARLMQQIAREMNFSESTFILPAEQGGTDVRMRIFTPSIEMPMAGHPTIGSTFALAHTGLIAPGVPRFVFGLNIGRVPVDLEWGGDGLRFAWMTQWNPVFGPVVQQRGAVAAALGLTGDDLVANLPVQEVSCGVPYLLVPLRDRETVDRAVSDATAFRRLEQTLERRAGPSGPGRTESLGRRVTPAGPERTEASLERRVSGSTGRSVPILLFTLSGSPSATSLPSVPSPPSLLSVPSPPSVLYSRMFAPGVGVVEDPATGSASGPLGCYLVQHGLVAADAAQRIVSLQGVAMGRASRIHIAITGTPGAISKVRVGGEAVLVGRGELLL